VFRTAGFFWQLSVTAAGAVLDYLIGRLANSPSAGIACWAALTLVGAAILEFSKDLRKESRSSTSSYPRPSSVLNLIRPVREFKWTTVTRAFWAAALAAAAYYAFALAVITFRFLAAGGGSWLGQGSPFDQLVVTFVSNFQASSETAAFIGGALLLALFVRSDVLLPSGIVAVAALNAWLARFPHMVLTASGPEFRSQIAYSLSGPDKWMFQLPTGDVLWGCLSVFLVGVIACGLVSAAVRS
jgi:hypothetical protein